MRQVTSRLLKNVMNDAKARQKLVLKRSLLGVNEHFILKGASKPIFNADFASAIVKQQTARPVLRRLFFHFSTQPHEYCQDEWEHCHVVISKARSD